MRAVLHAAEPAVVPRTGTTALRMTSIRKRFGGVHALVDGGLELRPGEVHGLIGENGSGKSTLLNIMSGQLRPDAGTIELFGDVVRFSGPQAALDAGVAMVTQELSLAPDLTVGENILLGHSKPRTWRGIDWRAVHHRAQETLDGLGVDLDSRTVAGRLRLDQQQLVEIARAISTNARIVVLDEATSSLTEEAVASLFAIVRRLRADGVAVVFVSHKMDELFEISDRLTVLRDGVTVASRPTAEYDRESLVADMLGHAPERFAPAAVVQRSGDAVIRVAEVCVPGAVHEVSFDVRPGEVVGLVGLAGAGRSQLLESLFGLHRSATGSLVVGGATNLPRSPRQAMQRGIALVPADRKNDGLILEMSIANNLAIPGSASAARLGRVRRRHEHRVAGEAVGRMSIVAPSTASPVGSLSGGNQQKVLLSKWLDTSPELLLLDEPTRGVDVGAKVEIHRLLLAARDDGLAVVVASSEIDELMTLCDRFVVMFLGRRVATIHRSEATESRLAHLAAGGAHG